jgi:GntR family transcriptional regulator of arabinose operon
MTKYEQLAETLCEKISENLAHGIYKLPTEAELCQKYRVSRQTVRSALFLLQERGVIESRQGSGSYATGLDTETDSNVIPILISSNQEYIYPNLLNDIRNELASFGYQLSVLETGNDTGRERAHLLSLLENPPRGLIAEGCKSAFPSTNLDLYEKLRAKGCFVLFLHNYYRELPDSIYVKDDNFYGGSLLAEHLINLGHTSIAGLFKVDDLQGQERYHGVSSCLRDHGLSLLDSHVGWFTSLDVEALEKKQDTRFLTSFIHEQLSGCTAVICYNDEIAYWIIKELTYAERLVPQDISVVCFDNSYLSDLSRVRITTLTHKPHEIGTCAADCMAQKLRGASIVSQELPWELVHKQSDGVCAE